MFPDALKIDRSRQKNGLHHSGTLCLKGVVLLKAQVIPLRFHS